MAKLLLTVLVIIAAASISEARVVRSANWDPYGYQPNAYNGQVGYAPVNQGLINPYVRPSYGGQNNAGASASANAYSEARVVRSANWDPYGYQPNAYNGQVGYGTQGLINPYGGPSYGGQNNAGASSSANAYSNGGFGHSSAGANSQANAYNTFGR